MDKKNGQVLKEEREELGTLMLWPPLDERGQGVRDLNK